MSHQSRVEPRARAAHRKPARICCRRLVLERDDAADRGPVAPFRAGGSEDGQTKSARTRALPRKYRIFWIFIVPVVVFRIPALLAVAIPTLPQRKVILRPRRVLRTFAPYR
jgi:hypothetical protein